MKTERDFGTLEHRLGGRTFLNCGATVVCANKHSSEKRNDVRRV
jgi:hypothetical protein